VTKVSFSPQPWQAACLSSFCGFGFRLGPTPGLAKLEGVQSMLWAVDLMEQGFNPARHIKGGDAVLDEGE
jgi:hypothetical protein